MSDNGNGSLFAALLGRKVGMTRIYDDKGTITPVTVVQAGPLHRYPGQDGRR